MLHYNEIKDTKMATIYGEVTVDKDGLVKGLTKEQEKELSTLPNFEYTEPKTTPKKTETKEEPKKTTTRKTTRKTTTKKDEE